MPLLVYFNKTIEVTVMFRIYLFQTIHYSYNAQFWVITIYENVISVGNHLGCGFLLKHWNSSSFACFAKVVQ